MAKTGIRHAVFATRNEAANGTVTYTGGKVISPVAGFDGSVNTANDKDYGDDVVVDSESGVTGGTLKVELNRDEDDIYVMLCGHEKDSTSGVITYNTDDQAPYVGAGAIGKSGSSWVAKWYPKVQFHEPNDENATRRENVTFNHVQLEGGILVPEDHVWKERKVFTELDDAIAWVDGKAGITGQGGRPE